jgi:hypothetical protein
VPEKSEEEGKSGVWPTRAVDDFNKHNMSIILVLLENGESNDQCQCGANVEKCVILRSIEEYINGITAVMRESHAVLRVFRRPWNRMIPVNTATV